MRPDGGAIAGFVTDIAGTPIEGARIVVDADVFAYETSHDGTSFVQTFERFAWSAADGAFEVGGLLEGDHRVVVRAAGYAPHVATSTTRAGETAKLAIALSDGAIVTGFVRGADGVAASGVPVRAGREATFSESSSVVSDADGSYRLESLPEGRIVVVAGNSTSGTARVEHDAISGVEQRVDLLLASGPTVSGRVEDEFGQPVAGARLDARDVEDGFVFGSTTSAANGAFEIESGSATSIDLDVYWDRGLVQPALRVRDIAAGAEGVVIRLPNLTRPSSQIVGRIEDLMGPVAGAEVLLLDADGPQGTLVLSAADGSFESPLLSPGRFRISVRSTTRAVYTSNPIVLEANTRHEAGTIRLASGGSLRVQLRRTAKVQELRPSISLERTEDGSSVFVDLEDDVGSATKVAPGSYLLSVAGENLLTQCTTIAIHEGEETRVEIALERAATSVSLVVAASSIYAETIRVTIDDAGGRRVHAGSAYRARRSDSFEHRVGLNPGVYRVTIEGPRGATTTREFEVAKDVESDRFEMSLDP